MATQAQLYVLDSEDVLYYSPMTKKSDDTELRLVVPEILQKDILEAYHGEMGAGAHQGVGRTHAKIRRYYYWRGLYKDVEKHIATCMDCCTGKGKPQYEGQSPGNMVAERPFQVVTMDFAIPLPKTENGNTALLLFTCMFSGYVILKPMGETTAQDVADAYLESVYKRFGGQEMIRHDRDPRFMSSVFKSFNRMMKQKQRPTLAYRPQANGKQERSVQTVMKAVKLYIEDARQADWDEYVPRLEFALNNTVNLQYKQSSFYLVHGYHPRSQLEAMIPPKDGSAKEIEALKWREKVSRDHEIAIAHAAFIQRKLMEDRAKKHNAKVESKTKASTRTEYVPGQRVWLYHTLVKEGLSRKLAHLWHGPYEIAEKIDEFAYKLKVDNREARLYPVVHVSRLKLFISPTTRPRDSMEVQGEFDEALLPEDSWEADQEAGEFEVEEIRDDRWKKKTRNGRRMKEYLVKWVGYDKPTWEPEENLSCTALLFEYDAKKSWERRKHAAQDADEESD